MKRLLILLTCVLFLVGLVSTDGMVKKDSNQLVINVKSTDSNQEVTVKASYMFFSNKSGDLITVEKTTPFSLTKVSERFVEIFKKVDGNSKIEVTVVEQSTNSDEQSELLSGSGNTIFVNEFGKRRWVNSLSE